MSTTNPTAKRLTPAEHIASWLYLDPKLGPIARKIAQGNDYAYGDNELAEFVDLLLYDKGANDTDFLWVIQYGASVAAADNIRTHIRQSTVDALDWSAVRTRLLDLAKEV